MFDDTIFDEMDLPLSSSNEDLETISSNYFQPLFDVKRFEIRPEKERDKGIDFYIELKKERSNGDVVYTNFRFAIQLKATNSISPNKDGSISLQIDTSNINYLRNNSMPAYYVLYNKMTKTFYYEEIGNFIKDLALKNHDWYNQTSHVLRFNKIIDEQAIGGMYNLTLKKGKFQLVLNKKTVELSQTINQNDKIQISANLDISDDREIRDLVEKGGFMLINQNRWKDVVKLHKKASGTVASTSLYNLVLGMANYYGGDLIASLSFLKNAKKNIVELPEGLKGHLIYFENATKYALGISSEKEYASQVDNLKAHSDIGLHIMLEEANNQYRKEPNLVNSFEDYQSKVLAIIDNPMAPANLKFNAMIEILQVEGENNVLAYIQNISRINAFGLRDPLYVTDAYNFINSFNEVLKVWLQQMDQLKHRSFDMENYLYISMPGIQT